MPSASTRSSLDFALKRPDAGQLALDDRVRRSTPAERAELAHQLRVHAFVLVNQAADAVGPMSELDRAVFILKRLYPEFGDDQVESIRGELAAREAAGTWQGFFRPGSPPIPPPLARSAD